MQRDSLAGSWRRTILFLLAFAMCLSLSGIANTATTKELPWIAKDWTQWTLNDCGIVFGQSPWGQRTESPGISMNGPRESAVVGNGVQLRSALPIRQALLRQQQLEEHYDKMKTDKKQVFDKDHMHDLDPTDQVRIYIVNMSVEPSPSNGSVRQDRVAGPEPPRQAALRLADGTLVLPIQTSAVKYAPSGVGVFTNQFEYVFPRVLAGKPLYSPSDSDLVVVQGAPLTIDKKTKRVVQEPFQNTGPLAVFKISDLMYKGKLEY